MIEARVVKWGNSRGVRIPRPLLEQAGIQEDVTLDVRDGEIIIRPRQAHPREGWEAAARAMVAAGQAELLWPDDMVDEFDKELGEW